jgi:hypothetical protein
MQLEQATLSRNSLRLVAGRAGIIAAAVLSAAIFTGPSAAAERRLALVIGNDAYPNAPLRNPVNDARAMGKTLGALGFDIMLRTNLTQRGMVEALRDFGARLGKDGVAVFYFSGHGMQVKGRNYLIPVDADIRGEDEVPYMSLDMAQVLDKLEVARSRANIVILDACRNNPFVRTFRSTRVGLAQMDAPIGTLIAFATAPGSEARDGDSEFGTYTRHLLKQVQVPGVPVEVMFRRVREAVTAETKNRQVPWESSSLRGDFYFNADAAAPAGAAPRAEEAPPAPAADSATMELAFWNSIKDSSNPEDYRAYLKQYPGGSFAGLARNRLTAPAKASVPPAPAPPQAAPPASPPPEPPMARKPPPEPPKHVVPGTSAARAGASRLAVGDTWTYRLVDQRHERTIATVTHEVVAIEGDQVTESIRVKDRPQLQGQEATPLGIQVREYHLASDVSWIEFAPFLAAGAELKAGQSWSDVPGMANASAFDRWQVSGRVVGRETVRTPAGEFEAFRVEINAIRPPPGSLMVSLYVTRVQLTAWYAPEAKRVVKTVRQSFNMARDTLDDDRYELFARATR